MADIFFWSVEEGDMFFVVSQRHQELGLQVGLIKAWESTTSVRRLKVGRRKGSEKHNNNVRTYVR